MKGLVFVLMLWSITFADFAATGTNSTIITGATAQATILSTLSLPAEDSSADDFGNPALMVGLLLVLSMLMAIGAALTVFTGFWVGAVLTVLTYLVVLSLVSLKVLSPSTVAAWQHKLSALRFKTLILYTSSVAGLLFCTTVTLYLNRILHWVSTSTAIASGMLAGALAGIAFGYTTYFILRRLTRRHTS